MITLKNIINDLNDFSNLHYQLNDFGWGNLANITTKDYTYPMMWVQPMNSIINNSRLTLSLDIYIMDLQEGDDSNLLDIMNECLLIGRDIISEYFEDNDGVMFELNEDNVRILPFEGKFDDLLAGWIYSVEIDLILNKNKCLTPTE